MVRAAGALVALVALCQPLLAAPCQVPEDFGLSDNDRARLEVLETSRTRGLAGALRGFVADEQAVVADLFEGGLAPVDADLLVGSYQCRTIKLGGNLPLVVYQWFRCDIGQEEGTFTVRKITGSQNFFGVLTPAGSGYAYKGASTYGYEDTVLFYGDDETRNQVGCLSAVRTDARHFVLELPTPPVESYHDVIEFKPE